METKHYFEEIGAWPKESGSLALSYAVGFVLSLALTFGAYFLATHPGGSSAIAVALLLALACLQFFIQLVCFLHVNGSNASRERLIVLCYTCTIVFILVVGSLWIMTHLNERMMQDPAQMEEYMNEQPGI